jgi:phage portal protein BeeE
VKKRDQKKKRKKKKKNDRKLLSRQPNEDRAYGFWMRLVAQRECLRS